MEELGRKFGPLEQASSNLWTSIKIGIMDIVGGPLTEFINKLTEAGRLAQQYGVLGGTGKVGRMINNLSGAREGNRQSVYQQQQEQFWRYIDPREQQIRDIQAWQRGERGEALQKRVSAITDKYGSLDATKIQSEVDAARKMLAEYQQSAKQILNPVSDTKPLRVEVKTSGGSGGGNSIANIGKFIPEEGVKNAPPDFKPMWDTTIFQEALRKELGMDGEQTRDWGKELGQVFADYVADPDKEKRDKANKANKNEKDLVKNLSTLTSGISTLTSGIKGLGIDLPKEVDDVIGIITSLTSIIQGVQTIISIFGNTAMAANTAAIIANTAALTANTATNFLPFAHGGIVQHAANGYYVPGTHASGDVTPILANAGELVLNKSSQNNLANELKGAEALVQTIDRYQTSIMRGSQIGSDAVSMGAGILGNLRLSAEVSAEQIYFILKNNGMRTGRGEFVTTNFR
jgi:hypothetical protein